MTEHRETNQENSQACDRWLDFGGADAEYLEHTAVRLGSDRRLFAVVDPLYRCRMVESGRIRSSAVLPPGVFRVGAGLGPSDDCTNRFLPFRDGVFHHVVCRYVLHLYLTIVDPFVAEVYRVLIPGGDLTIRLPDWGNAASTTNIAYIVRALVDGGFSLVDLGEAANEDCTPWDEIYQGCGYQLKAIREMRDTTTEEASPAVASVPKEPLQHALTECTDSGLHSSECPSVFRSHREHR